MKMTGKKKLVGTFLIVGTLAISLIIVCNLDQHYCCSGCS
jgi:hypothetical protein